MKNKTEIPIGKLMANKISEKLWIYLIVNFITKLSLVVEKNIIPVVYNRLSKMAYFMATTEGISAENFTRLFRNNV